MAEKHIVTLVNLQRQLAIIRCCAKNHFSVTAGCERFFAIFAVLQRVASFWKRFKSVTCLQIRARNMRCESALHKKLALQVDQCNITFTRVRVKRAGPHARTARVLLFMVIPGHLIFLYAIRALQAGHTSLTLVFTSAYLAAALLQVGDLVTKSSLDKWFVCLFLTSKRASRTSCFAPSSIPSLPPFPFRPFLPYAHQLRTWNTIV